MLSIVLTSGVSIIRLCASENRFDLSISMNITIPKPVFFLYFCLCHGLPHIRLINLINSARVFPLFEGGGIKSQGRFFFF